jgi:putative nucleotidyltransferase with HDIG domain
VEIINDVTVRRNQEKESALLSLALAESFEGITEALSDLVESRDPYTAGHSRHVAKLAVKTGEKMGFDEDSLKGLRICALLHDIGKAIIPAGILNKPGKLSEHEWGLIKQHPVTAFETLKHIPFPWPVADVVLQHHERLDGTGYPNGIFEDDIHPWARIISVADITDAMTSHRPYRPRMPKASSLTELRSYIRSGCGTGFHPGQTGGNSTKPACRQNHRNSGHAVWRAQSAWTGYIRLS